jgi:RNA polymerase sigma-B factor
VADHVGSEDPGYHRVECLTTLESAIPALSNEQRTVLRLRYGQDLTQHQIAVRLGRSRSEVARDLRDAVGRLRAVAA